MTWLAFTVTLVLLALVLQHAYLEYAARRTRRRAARVAARRPPERTGSA